MGGDGLIHPSAAKGFDVGAADYERARPGYPHEVGDVLARELGLRAGSRVCDLAAGTGKFTRLLVNRGLDVVAVEPVAGMRAQLDEVLPEVDVLDGTAEAIPLPDSDVDAVTVAQAFHWFRFPEALAEIARVLRPGGAAVLVWNRRDESVEWVRRMSEVIDWRGRTVAAYDDVDWAAVIASGGFESVGHHEIAWEQPMNRDLLAARVRSISYIGEMEPVDQQAAVDRVMELVADEPEEFPLPYNTMLWWGSKPALLTWWERAGRHDLPWRATLDPWAVLVSELMLQQTQVPRVVPRYAAFLDRFPTPAACAAAPVGDVVRAWEGLGYNRRAVNLHRCATAVVDRHGGTLPDTLDELLALPGIGPYTARAVLVFAYEDDRGLVDTNAGRFVARALAGRAVTPKEAQSIADAAVPAGDAWRWGSAVFDLGAAICTKRSPRCDVCPLRANGCAWAAAGFPEPDPVEGSAGISTPQSRFDGSDRQGRGRLVDALRRGPVADVDLANVMGWPADPERAARVAATVAADGIAVVDAGVYELA